MASPTPPTTNLRSADARRTAELMAEPAEARPTWRAAAAAWGRQWASAMVSIIFHTLLVAGLGLWAYGGRGEGELEGEEVQIAQLPIAELEDDPAPELQTTQADSGAQQESDLELLEVTPLTVSDAGQLELVDVAGGMGVGGQGSMQLAGSQAEAAGMAGQASFMGLQARGRRFCIIADCSGSMRGGKLEYVRQEIVKTVSELTGGTQFQVYFFNGRAIPFPLPGWRRPVDLRELSRWVESIKAGGSTHPETAFRQAMELTPRPDGIFFMTDGKFDDDVVDQIAKWNATGRRTPIHTITFIDRSAEALMKKIAADSGGRYRHVAGF